VTAQLDLCDTGPRLRPHPAVYPAAVLDAFRRLVPKGLVLDPFGGTGRIGRIGPQWRAISSELEPEWAGQGYRNRCALCVVADARHLPFATGSIPAIATSPAYGNRMADHDASQLRVASGEGLLRSDETRATYTSRLGRRLTSGNAGEMLWGDGRPGDPLRNGDAYRALHAAVWTECLRVLRPGGALVVNCKDHLRDGHNGGSGPRRQAVCEWHWETLRWLGFTLTESVLLPLQGDRNTVRMRAAGLTTIDHEEVTAWRKP